MTVSELGSERGGQPSGGQPAGIERDDQVVDGVEVAAPIEQMDAHPIAFGPSHGVLEYPGVDETIGRAGIDADGEMEVPDFGDAAWFTPSVKPGRVGPSVITGHVDSRQGPDVFFDLKDLDADDQIEVHGQNGEVVVFAVSAVEQHDKGDYPRDKVHGATDGPELRLITCGGIFDRSVGHYNDNIIVFAQRLTA